MSDNPTADFSFKFDEGEVEVTLEFHLSENAEDFFDVKSLINAMARGAFEGLGLE